MSIALFASELNRFLSSAEPEVLCITGPWGVGKTFAWNHYLKTAQESKSVKLERYSYVSLFGRNSLDDVRTAIVENTVDSRVVGEKPSLISLKSLVAQVRTVVRYGPLLGGFFQNATAYALSANRILFLLLKAQLVCIDDLERAGNGLNAMDVLGLVSSLKVEKSCKVVIILNDEFLSGDNEKAFKTQLEKVADTVISFEPTPNEAAEIGVDKSTTFHMWLAEDIRSIGVVNIRIIKKIESFCRRVHQLVAEYDPRILQQAVQTLALAGYAKFQPLDAPSLAFIKNYNSFNDRMAAEKNITGDPDRRHRDLLRNYGWSNLDEFDAALIDGIERGLFDEEAIKRRANALHKKLQLTDKNNSFEQAWRLFHDSFDDDQEIVLDALFESIKTNVEAVPPSGLSQTITFLKEFGRGDQAKQALQLYVDSRHEMPEFWNLAVHPFQDLITDLDVKKAFSKKFDEVKVKPDTREILIRLGKPEGWSPEDIVHLASQSEPEYVEIFKRLRSTELKNALKGALSFRNISNADEQMKTITRTVEGALRQIAAENPMNAKRVRSYGVRVDESTVPATPSHLSRG